MTALEKLIKTASMDSAPHYRELAKEAQKEYAQLLEFAAFCGWKHDEALKMFVQPLANSPCTTTPPMSK